MKTSHSLSVIFALVAVWSLLPGTARAQLMVAPLRTLSTDELKALMPSEETRAAEARLQALLAKPFRAKFDHKPLAEAIGIIAKSCGVPIEIDQKALAEASIPADLPIDCDLPPISLRSALDLILEPTELVWAIRDERLLLTTRHEGNNPLITRLYSLKDLMPSWRAEDRLGLEPSTIALAVERSICEESWFERGSSFDEPTGPDCKFVLPPALLVSQTARAHQEIAILLEALRQARERQRLGSESAPPKDLSAESLKPIAIQPEAQRIAAERIRAMMRKPYSGHFEDVPLSKALAEVARSTGLPMYVDWDVLGYASITPDTPITCHLAGMSLSASLHVILERVGLGYAVRDEVLFVSTQDKLSNFAVAKVYPVRDLVGGRAPLDGYYLGLAQLITDFVSPTTWEGGGPPPIEGVRSAGAIVFSQTETAHQQVEVLLTALRTARDRQRSAFDKAGADENTVNESMQPITVQTDLQQATEKRIREQLEKRFSLCLNGKPNSQALSEIMRVTGVPIHLARSAIEARAPLDLSAVTLNADFSLRSQLDSIVSRANLAWTFGDECLLITTRDEAADEHILKVYPVRDLIDRPFPGEGRARFNPRLTSDEDLDLWGAAQFYREADAIAASETRAAHGRIQGFLGLVRAARRQRGEAAAAPGLPQPPIGLDQPQQSDAAKRLQTTPPAPAK